MVASSESDGSFSSAPIDAYDLNRGLWTQLQPTVPVKEKLEECFDTKFTNWQVYVRDIVGIDADDHLAPEDTVWSEISNSELEKRIADCVEDVRSPRDPCETRVTPIHEKRLPPSDDDVRDADILRIEDACGGRWPDAGLLWAASWDGGTTGHWSGNETGYMGVLRYANDSVECEYVYTIVHNDFPEVGSLPQPSVSEGLIQTGPAEGQTNEVIVWAHPEAGILKSTSSRMSGHCHLPEEARDVFCVDRGQLNRFVRRRGDGVGHELTWAGGCEFPKGLMNWAGRETRLLGLLKDNLGVFAGEFSQGERGLVTLFVANLKSCEVKFARGMRGTPTRIFSDQSLLVVSHEDAVLVLDAASGMTLAGPYAVRGAVDDSAVDANGVYVRVAGKWLQRQKVDPFAVRDGFQEIDFRLGPYSQEEVRSRWRARSQ